MGEYMMQAWNEQDDNPKMKPKYPALFAAIGRAELVAHLKERAEYHTKKTRMHLDHAQTAEAKLHEAQRMLDRRPISPDRVLLETSMTGMMAERRPSVDDELRVSMIRARHHHERAAWFAFMAEHVPEIAPPPPWMMSAGGDPYLTIDVKKLPFHFTPEQLEDLEIFDAHQRRREADLFGSKKGA